MIVFFVSFIVYLYTLFPGVAPYRDTGEMVSVAHTLGVAHPPGYPFYTLLSKIWLLIEPFGNEGFRLNVLSALGGAATAWLLYRVFLTLAVNRVAAGFLALVFAFSYLQWYLSLVSEMYTLSTMFAAAVMLLMVLIIKKDTAGVVREEKKRLKNENSLLLYAMGFIFGAGLGVRMDMLLIFPAVLIAVYSKRKEFKTSDFFVSALFAAAGFSVFLYLPLRSFNMPILDWNHPASLEKLWGTIARKTHGGTLDLVSAPYASGANFPATIKFYFNHLFSGFAYIGMPLAIAGFAAQWKRERILAAALFSGWFFSGPFFIYMANMPPNPHALAILEAHFLLPNIFITVFIAEGLNVCAGRVAAPVRNVFAVGVCFLMFSWQLYGNLPELNKRGNFIAYDYAKNILRSLPENAILVMKKDVQLFALWNQQYVRKQRTDCAIVSQGLSASPWYKTGFRKMHPGIILGPLRNAENWKTFIEKNDLRKFFFSPDTEYHKPAGYYENPKGLVCGLILNKGKEISTGLLDEVYSYRGRYVYNEYREFFTPDIIEDYARARIASGRYYFDRMRYKKAKQEFISALVLQPLLPRVYNLIAFSYVQENNYALAKKNYLRAAEQFVRLLSLAVSYNALDDVRNSISKDIAEAYISLGVCFEKESNDNESLACYAKALEAHPGAVKAYFNRAVIFWKKGDWKKVINELEKALRINPNYNEAAYYLGLAKKKSGQ